MQIYHLLNGLGLGLELERDLGYFFNGGRAEHLF